MVERTLCITACTHVWVPALARRHPPGLGDTAQLQQPAHGGGLAGFCRLQQETASVVGTAGGHCKLDGFALRRA